MSTTSRRARAGLLLAALVLPALGACSSDGSDGSGGAGSASGGSSSAPSKAPTGSPFSMTITGPDTAEPGQSVTATLTNTGRLPDAYRLQPDPFDAVTIPSPEVRLAPGESAEISMTIVSVPVLVRVQSTTAGLGGSAGVLSIGSTG